ncbi:MAG: hypothetical protein ACOWWO_16305 [Peptococcaceae bacterium]
MPADEINHKSLDIAGRLAGNEYCLLNDRITLARKKYAEIANGSR